MNKFLSSPFYKECFCEERNDPTSLSPNELSNWNGLCLVFPSMLTRTHYCCCVHYHQVNSYGEGAAGWPGLRKLSVWQSTGAMQAEMEARLGKEAAEAAASAQPTLATSAAVDEMERVSGSKAESPSSPRAEGQGAKDGPPSSNGNMDAAEADDAADAKSSDRGGAASPGSEAKALGVPLTAEAKDGGGGLRDHGAGLGDTARMGRQSLGAFHRLAPLGKGGPGAGGSELGKLNLSLGNSPGGLKAPWDATGKPLASLGSPFGKPSPLDFKKSP